MSGLGVALVGAGRWGRVLLRALATTPRVSVRCVVEPDAATRAELAAGGHPTAQHADAALSDPAIDAVVIAAPASCHASLAVRALDAGKHVLVEKPLALSLADAEGVRAAAHRAGTVAMVGHLLRFHPAFEALETAVARGELGTLRHLRATRVGPGTVRRHENAWWSLAPHDLAMILALVGEVPVRVSAHGAAYLQPGVADLATAHLEFADGATASLHVSWLAPERERRLVVVGDRGMAAFDDGLTEGKLRLRELAALPTESAPPRGDPPATGFTPLEARHLPVGTAEPLRAELEHFVAAILDGCPLRSGIDDALDVVRVLEAGQRALGAGGSFVDVS